MVYCFHKYFYSYLYHFLRKTNSSQSMATEMFHCYSSPKTESILVGVFKGIFSTADIFYLGSISEIFTFSKAIPLRLPK